MLVVGLGQEDIEVLEAISAVGKVDVEGVVEAAVLEERGVDGFRSIGSGEDDDAHVVFDGAPNVPSLEIVESDAKSGHEAAAELAGLEQISRRKQRIELVDEEERGRRGHGGAERAGDDAF